MPRLGFSSRPLLRGFVDTEDGKVQKCSARTETALDAAGGSHPPLPLDRTRRVVPAWSLTTRRASRSDTIPANREKELTQ